MASAVVGFGLTGAFKGSSLSPNHFTSYSTSSFPKDNSGSIRVGGGLPRLVPVPLKIESAHKKGAGSTKNGRDSRGQRLGVKIYGDQVAKPGAIIVRQRGTKFHLGKNVGLGKDHTIFSLIHGLVKIDKFGPRRKKVGVYPCVVQTENPNSCRAKVRELFQLQCECKKERKEGDTSPQLVLASTDVLSEDKTGRRQILAIGAIASIVSSLCTKSMSFATETKKGFQLVLDRKDGYSFYYPFGWQEVVVQGQDKVFKDVIEPLESVSVNLIATDKQDVRDLGSPQQVAETLIKKVLSSPTQKTKLVEVAERDVDGQTYYTFEFISKAPNFTRHALGTITIGNGKFYTLTTGANERRWDKMKDKLHTVVDSFKLSTV